MKQEKLCEAEDMTDKDYSHYYLDPVEQQKFKEELGAENAKRAHIPAPPPMTLEALENIQRAAAERVPEAMQEWQSKRQVAGDKVNKPNHYTAGGIEVIDYIRAKLTPDQLKGYYVGNLLKYLSRADHKGGVEDYKKAQVYLRWLIELEEKQGTHTDG